MIKLLRGIMFALGAAIVVIGAAHALLGAQIILGVGEFSSSIDSEDSFFGAIFIGYGVAWIISAQRSDRRLTILLAGIFFLGGMARVLSMWRVGVPDTLYVFLTGVELILPVVIVVMAQALPARASP